MTHPAENDAPCPAVLRCPDRRFCPLACQEAGSREDPDHRPAGYVALPDASPEVACPVCLRAVARTFDNRVGSHTSAPEGIERPCMGSGWRAARVIPPAVSQEGAGGAS